MKIIKEFAGRYSHMQRSLLVITLVLFAGLLSFIAPGEAQDSGSYYRLDLKEAQNMALQNNNQLQIARDSLELASLTLKQFEEQVVWMEEQEEALGEEVAGLEKREAELNEQIAALEERAEEIIAELDELLDINLEDLDIDIDTMLELIDEVRAALDKLQEDLDALADSLESLDEIAEVLEAIENTLDELAVLLEDVDSVEDFEEIVEKMQELAALQSELLQLIQELELSENIRNIADSLGELQEAVQELLDFLEEENFREVITEFLTDLSDLPQEAVALQQELVDIQIELVMLRAELFQVEATLETYRFFLNNFDFFAEQIRTQIITADEALQNAEATMASQEELLLYAVEAMFAGVAIMEKQFPLVQEGISLLSQLVKAEKDKEEEGYSSALQIIDLEVQLREIERGEDALNSGYIELMDQLCLLLGLKPGANIELVLFEPKPPKEVSLEESLEKVLAEGYLLRQRRDTLEEREEELRDLRELMEEEDEDDFEDSLMYQIAVLRVDIAENELKDAEDKAYAEVRRTYYALKDAEREIERSRAALEESLIQEKALLQSLEGGYVTAAQSAAGPLGTYRSEAELYTARFQYHLKLREFELAEEGHDMSGFRGMTDISGGTPSIGGAGGFGSGATPGFGGTSGGFGAPDMGAGSGGFGFPGMDGGTGGFGAPDMTAPGGTSGMPGTSGTPGFGGMPGPGNMDTSQPPAGMPGGAPGNGIPVP